MSNKNKNSKLYTGLLITFYSFYSIIIASIIVISVLHPQNNLTSPQLIIGVPVATAFFLMCAFLWNSFSRIIPEKTHRILKIALLIMLGLLLFIVSFNRSTFYNTFPDYSYLYNGALDMADTGTLRYPKYFLNFPNNTRPMLFLSVIFRLSHKAGISEFYPVLIISIVTVLASVWAAMDMLSDDTEGKWTVPAIIFIMIYLPLYVLTPAFYTDTLSFGTGVIALALCRRAIASDKRKGLYSFLAAFITVYGIMCKVTALIPLVAGLIVILLKKEYGKFRKLLPYAVFTVLFLVAMNMCMNRNPIYRQSKEVGNPVISWIALGSSGDGGYYQGMDFYLAIYDMDSKAEKTEASLNYIVEHKDELFSLDHITGKISYNFGTGTMTCNEFMWNDSDGTLLWELMASWGKYYWRTSQLCFIYIFICYMVILIGSLICFADLVKRKPIPVIKLLADISLFGIILFLMIWEAKGRQIYNQFPMLIVNLFVSADIIMKKLTNAKKGNRNNG